MSKYHKQLQTTRWKATRLRVLARDEYRCQMCGKAGMLEVDHIVPLHRDPKQDYYKLENLQTLCRSCHIKKSRKDRKQLKKRTPFDAMIERMMG